jgi:hypothetical protein
VAAVETVYELDRLVTGEPKSEVSIRKVVPPELIIPDLARHLETFAGRGRMASYSSASRAASYAVATSPSRGNGYWPSRLRAKMHVHDLRNRDPILAEHEKLAHAASTIPAQRPWS